MGQFHLNDAMEINWQLLEKYSIKEIRDGHSGLFDGNNWEVISKNNKYQK